MPTRSAWPGRGRVSGRLRAISFSALTSSAAASASASTGSGLITVCHLGHSELPTRIAIGDPRVQPVPHPAEELDLVLLELHPGAAAVAQPAAGQGARRRRPW